MDVSADRQIREITAQKTIKKTAWFVMDIFTNHQDIEGKIHRTGSHQVLVRAVGAQLFALDHSKETMWVNFAASAGQPYPSPGKCRTKATNSPTPEHFVVLYDRTCADAGLLDETFVIHVGLESFTMDSFSGSHTWKLIAAHVDGKDLEH